MRIPCPCYTCRTTILGARGGGRFVAPHDPSAVGALDQREASHGVCGRQPTVEITTRTDERGNKREELHEENREQENWGFRVSDSEGIWDIWHVRILQNTPCNCNISLLLSILQ